MLLESQKVTANLHHTLGYGLNLAVCRAKRGQTCEKKRYRHTEFCLLHIVVTELATIEQFFGGVTLLKVHMKTPMIKLQVSSQTLSIITSGKMVPSKFYKTVFLIEHFWTNVSKISKDAFGKRLFHYRPCL